MHNNAHWIRLQADLLERGFNLARAFRVGDLPEAMRQSLPSFGQVPAEEQTLILVASGGTALWDAMQRSEGGAPALQGADQDPVDRYSVSSLQLCLDKLTEPRDRALLYPTDPSFAAQHFTGATAKSHVSLQQLGTLAAWHQPSPMGIGINQTYGLWFAYRSLVLLDCSFERETNESESVSDNELVCKQCQSVDCVTQCPAQAVKQTGLPDMQACSAYRISENSACQTQCLARKACPVGKSLRYHDAQIEYHYSISLESIKKRLQKSSQ